MELNRVERDRSMNKEPPCLMNGWMEMVITGEQPLRESPRHSMTEHWGSLLRLKLTTVGVGQGRGRGQALLDPPPDIPDPIELLYVALLGGPHHFKSPPC